MIKDDEIIFTTYRYSPDHGPLIEDASMLLLEIMMRIYHLCRSNTDISNLRKDLLQTWIVNRYKKRYYRDYGNLIPVDQISFVLPKPNNLYRIYKFPFNTHDILQDIDDTICSDNCNYSNTINYNNDMYTVALSIYVVPFDSVDITQYEICSIIEALSSLEEI